MISGNYVITNETLIINNCTMGAQIAPHANTKCPPAAQQRSEALL